MKLSLVFQRCRSDRIVPYCLSRQPNIYNNLHNQLYQQLQQQFLSSIIQRPLSIWSTVVVPVVRPWLVKSTSTKKKYLLSNITGRHLQTMPLLQLRHNSSFATSITTATPFTTSSIMFNTNTIIPCHYHHHYYYHLQYHTYSNPTKNVVPVVLSNSSLTMNSMKSFSTLSHDTITTKQTIATTNDTDTSSSDKNQDTGKNKSNNTSSSNNNSNIFLDNIGTIFLIFIGSIIGWLVRSYYNNIRRTTIRDIYIESVAHGDPIELDEIRIANSEITPIVFNNIQQCIMNQLQNQQQEQNNIQDENSSTRNDIMMLTYPEFVYLVRKAMIQQMKGDAFTIQYGHVIDRIVVAALVKEYNKNIINTTNDTIGTTTSINNDNDHEDDTNNSNNNINQLSILDTVKMPIEFWLTVLSLALYSSPTERIQVLHNVFTGSSNNNNIGMSMEQVIQLIGYLQDTCQIVPDAQIIMTNHKYPLQEYIVGTPEQMIDLNQWYNDNNMSDQNNEKSSNNNKSNNKNNSDDTIKKIGNNITVEMLSDILSSRSVCAWGECYKYKSK